MNKVIFYNNVPYFNPEEVTKDISGCESFVKMTEDFYTKKPKEIFIKIKEHETIGDLWIDLESNFQFFHFDNILIAQKGMFTLRQALDATLKHIERHDNYVPVMEPFHSRYDYMITFENGKYVPDPDALPF